MLFAGRAIGSMEKVKHTCRETGRPVVKEGVPVGR